MRRRRRVLLALLVLAAAVGGCGDEQTASTTGERAERARLMRDGARVFAEHCQTCHPLLGRPNTGVHTDYPPGLDLDQVAPTPALARKMVVEGGVAMGSYREALSQAEQRAVIAYVLEVGGREATVPDWPTRGQLAQGRRVYDEHCQRCHQIEGRPATRHNPIWIGTNFEELRPSVLHVERIVREGQFEAMPSFRRRLSLEEIRAVALYVNAAAR